MHYYQSNMENILALIDLGSSTVKLYIYDRNKNKFLVKKYQTINMAENFFPLMFLKPEAMTRVIKALLDFKKLVGKYGVGLPVLVSTGIARKAKNIEDLKNKIETNLGWCLRVISGNEEAEILYKGVAYDFDPTLKIAAINVGGGSTELVLGSSFEIRHCISLPIGVSNLNEKFLISDPPGKKEIDDMMSYISDSLLDEWPDNFNSNVLIHTGGELTYMRATGHLLEDSDFSPSHSKMITLQNFRNKFHEICSIKKDKLHRFMPNNPNWMDGAVSCTAIAITIADKTDAKYIVPSDKNLIDGLLLEYLEGGG